jgi:AAT family amino acid transporter
MASADVEKVPHGHATSPDPMGRVHSHMVNEDRLRRSLSARQVQMIAIGGLSCSTMLPIGLTQH